MSLRFFSDQCVPGEITDILRRHGHEVTLLRDVLPIRSLDPVVIAKAQELGAILLTLNGDFSDIVTYPPAAYLGIVAVQLHNHPKSFLNS
jgi:predicted nuclease of predicted toxin-antitoxin system